MTHITSCDSHSQWWLTVAWITHSHSDNSLSLWWFGVTVMFHYHSGDSHSLRWLTFGLMTHIHSGDSESLLWLIFTQMITLMTQPLWWRSHSDDLHLLQWFKSHLGHSGESQSLQWFTVLHSSDSNTCDKESLWWLTFTLVTQSLWSLAVTLTLGVTPVMRHVMPQKAGPSGPSPPLPPTLESPLGC